MISSTTSKVLTSAASYGLTMLDTAKDELGLSASSTDKDDWITRTIGQASRAIMNYTNRVFAPELVQDYITIQRSRRQVPSGRDIVQLSRWPIMMIASIAQSTSTLGAATAFIEGTDFRVDYSSGELYRLDADTGMDTSWEPLPLTVDYIAGYGDMVVESDTVPGAPYQITVAQSAVFSCDQGVTSADGTALVPVTGTPVSGQYTVSAGQYTFAAVDAGKQLTIGYATFAVPDDVEQACLMLLSSRFHAKGRDPRLMEFEEPNVGRSRWWISSNSGQKSGLPPEIADVLSNYEVPVVA